MHFGLFDIAAIFGLFGIAAIQSFSSHTGINLNVVSFNLDLHQNLVIAIIDQAPPSSSLPSPPSSSAVVS